MASQLLFNFYDLFVNTLFGNIMLSILAVAFLMIVILMITKSSMQFILVWLSFYFVVMFTFYFGTIAIVLGFIATGTYFSVALIRLIGRLNG